MEAAVQALVGRHRRDDAHQDTRGGDNDRDDGGLSERERRTLEGKLAKVRAWLAEDEDKLGRSGKPVKSNLTDNDSAKMASSHGVIQGYLGVTVVDASHQVIVNAQAFGEAQERTRRATARYGAPRLTRELHGQGLTLRREDGGLEPAPRGSGGTRSAPIQGDDDLHA